MRLSAQILTALSVLVSISSICFLTNVLEAFPHLRHLSSAAPRLAALFPWTTDTTRESASQDQSTSGIATSKFFDQIFSEHVNDHDVSMPELRRVCQTHASTWKHDVYLSCMSRPGGLTTMYSSVKACFTIATTLGMNLIIPTSPIRGDNFTDVFDWSMDRREPLNKYVDISSLRDRFSTICPSMKVIDVADDLSPNLPGEVHETESFDFFAPKTNWTLGLFPFLPDNDLWPAWMNTIIEGMTATSGATIVNMIVIHSMLHVAHNSNLSRLWSELSILLRPKQEIRSIVESLLFRLADPNGKRIPYFGLHFRAEADMLAGSIWQEPKSQISRAIQDFEKARHRYNYTDNDPRVIYVACGDAEQLQNIHEVALEKGWTTVDKWSLAQEFDPQIAQAIDEMPFDQAAIIDFAILLYSEFFSGLGASALSSTVAHLRSPSGRYLGNSLDEQVVLNNTAALIQRSHLDNGVWKASDYQCCL